VVTRSYADRRVLLYRLNPSTQGAITAWLVGTDIGAPYRLQLARRSEEDKR
jgi:hypothetical protein